MGILFSYNTFNLENNIHIDIVQQNNRSKHMTTKMKVVFQSTINQGSRIKMMTIHPIKKWIGMINYNNTFSLWNYEQKILIKSFSCNTLDDAPIITNHANLKNQIRQIVFFDRHSLCSKTTCSTNSMKNNIIFVTPTKLFFYDFITDVIKQLSEKQFQQKNIKKVCPYTQDQICVAMVQGSFKVIDCKDLYSKNSMTVRTIKGFHNKPITWIFSYAQNQNQMPRVITASAQDGAMACWNVDMILRSTNPNQQFATPCFKFTSNSKLKGKESGAGEQLIALQHDPSSYRLVTLSQNWIKLWSTMTGMEVRRVKNSGSKYVNILFFSHFSYPTQSFIAQNQGSKIHLVRFTNTNLEINQEIDLKTLFPGSSTMQEPLNILKIKSTPHHPSHLFLITNYNVAILEIDKFYLPAFGTSQSFFTKLSTINSKQFITSKSELQIRKDIKAHEISKIKFEEDILLNTFYLSVDHQWIYFNLVEIQYSSMLHETRKYKMLKIQPTSPLAHSQGGRSAILINFDGKQSIIFNKNLQYYEVYEMLSPFVNHSTYEDLLNKSQKIQNTDFYSRYKLLGTGYCRQIVWHQYKNQFAVIAGLDQKNQFIEFKVTKQKKSIFGNSKQNASKVARTGNPVKFCICIYHYIDGQYRIVQKTDPILSKYYKLYCFGNFYGYSVAKSNVDLIQFVSAQANSVRQIQGNLHAPEAVYISYCESFYILSYDKFFIVYRQLQNGNMVYMRTLEYTLLHGYFWEKLFFFLSQTSLYFLHINNNEIITIKIADVANYSSVETPVQIENLQDDDFEPDCKLLPAGQLQIAGLVNMSIMVLNQSSNISLISLQNFPYIIFCLEVATQTVDKSGLLLQKAAANIRKLMKQMVYNYGMVMHVFTE